MSSPERGVGNSGGLPGLQQLADILTNVFHANEKRTLLEIACSLGVPIFDGYGDGEQAEHWWERMEVVLESMDCPAERKVEVAVFFLSGSAASWWRNLKQTYSQSIVVTWEQFQESFNTRFCSLKFKLRKRNEFLKLQQGDMRVNDYKQKFQELSRYCPDIANSSIEMMIQFHLGLQKEIRGATACSQCATYLDVFQIAQSVEESLVEPSLGMDARGGGTGGYHGSKCQPHSKFSMGGPRYQQSFKKSNRSSGSSGGGSNLSTHRSRMRSSRSCQFSDVRQLDAFGKTCIQLCGRGKRRHGGECQQSSFVGCFKCGQQGHMQRECPNLSTHGGECQQSSSAGCFKCGQQGHMQRECPNLSTHRSRTRSPGSSQFSDVRQLDAFVKTCIRFCGRCKRRHGGECQQSSSVGCFKCGQQGHMQRECPAG